MQPFENRQLQELAEREAADVLVLAVGAAPIVPDIPGIHSPKVVLANNLSDEGIAVGKKVVILGGGSWDANPRCTWHKKERTSPLSR